MRPLMPVVTKGDGGQPSEPAEQKKTLDDVHRTVRQAKGGEPPSPCLAMRRLPVLVGSKEGGHDADPDEHVLLQGLAQAVETPAFRPPPSAAAGRCCRGLWRTHGRQNRRGDLGA